MIDPLYAEALDTFGRLFERARTLPAETEPNAMTVATATPDGRPSARTVLLKSFDPRGFVFYTHYESRKGRELQANPRAALLLLWRSMEPAGVQVRVDGAVERVDAAEADAYFASRARMSQLGAWASRQSATLESRQAFEAELARVQARFEGVPVPRPPHWGGLRVVPEVIEFWYGAGFRLHERWRYERGEDDTWSKRMLQP